MNNNLTKYVAVGIFSFAMCAPVAHSQDAPKMKMTTDIPVGAQLRTEPIQIELDRFLSLLKFEENEKVKDLHFSLDQSKWLALVLYVVPVVEQFYIGLGLIPGKTWGK